MANSLPIKVFDFFSGCGGTSKGFRDAGMDIAFALDNDVNANKTFKQNFPGVLLSTESIEDVSTESLLPLVTACKGHPLLFSGCAPCQPFTKQNTKRKKNDNRTSLLDQFRRFVEAFSPEFIFVENVPGMQKVDDKDGPFISFVNMLKEKRYFYKYDILVSQRYGIPQMRRRLVLIASLNGPIDFPEKTHGPGTPNPKYASVREWIEDLPHLDAGENHLYVPNHRAASLSTTNLERIRATPLDGGRLDWPPELRLACHTNGYTGHTDVYGRMSWDLPASGLTTRCISLSNGRFGHPEQNRAISVREAACLQTFPRDFIFYGNLNSMARQIGNAVPVLLAKRFGENFIRHWQEYNQRNLG